MEATGERWWHLGAERHRWNKAKTTLGKITAESFIIQKNCEIIQPAPVIQLPEQPVVVVELPREEVAS